MNSGDVAVLIASIAAALAAGAGWWLDQRRLACATRWRALPATLLLLVSVWVAALIVATFALKVPGAYGPVQYWHSDPNALAFMSGPRTWAMFAVWGSMLLAPVVTITMFVSLFRPSGGPRRRRVVLPALALMALSAAFALFATVRFFPSA
jgi:hypothetical protein